ncbi:MAG: MBL fold metallo-hydrolase [Candidatus Heimdallarchaeota archaeon]|nr:MBL fold metallo-hydrolase [Candidatus Heimdallarchaeota archaeon]MCK4611810.1 MBL fold metallo-hydrolase [Candidatus Heimdallarchaeota archaeon]
MQVQKIGSRGILFNLPSQPFSVQIYCIKSPNYLFIIDTGVVLENQMKEVKKYLEENNLLAEPVVIINTHQHHDHIGGNGVIESDIIIGHTLSSERIKQTVELLENYEAYKPAIKTLKPPNLTFEKRIVFDEEGVEIFYSLGHTEDSASCYDRVDKILIVGDTLVHPLPSINWHELDRFIETLENYKKIDFNKMILGHEKVLEDAEFIDETIEYIKRFKALDVDFTVFTDVHALMYRWGLVNLAENLKRAGKEVKAKKYYLKAKSDIENPIIKPKDEKEYRGMIEEIEKGIKDLRK